MSGSVSWRNKAYRIGWLQIQIFVVFWNHVQINLGKDDLMRFSLMVGLPMEFPNRKTGVKTRGEVTQSFTRYGFGPFALTFSGKP